MRLLDLEKYDPITIQCHDNPDADALGAGYGLYCYFKSKGHRVRLVYSGKNRIQKSNLKLMIQELSLPVEYVDVADSVMDPVEGLLVTVDCQYGAGNVTKFHADHVAVIDHHQQEMTSIPLMSINPNLGSCCTLVWRMLCKERFVIDDENGLGTALYYGLYTDTNQFSELSYPLDMDMRESLPYNKSLITLFRNSNLSLRELEIAGVAMLRYSFNDDYNFSVIKSQPCDPNVLGIISDFLLQVDQIKTCVVFNEVNDGYKFSVRSCIREVNASELAAYLSEGIGSGGGHYEKAGGFISMKLYEEHYPTLHAEGYFNNRMVEYFDSFEMVYASEYHMDVSEMKRYEKKKLPIGFVKIPEVFPIGMPITVRSMEGDLELIVQDDLYLLIGLKGEVHPVRESEFQNAYRKLDEKFCVDEAAQKWDYIPTIKKRTTGLNISLTDYAWKCVPQKERRVYAKPLEKGVKLFTHWNKDKYMLGKKGDYLVAPSDDPKDIFIEKEEVFRMSYVEVKK